MNDIKDPGASCQADPGSFDNYTCTCGWSGSLYEMVPVEREDGVMVESCPACRGEGPGGERGKLLARGKYLEVASRLKLLGLGPLMEYSSSRGFMTRLYVSGDNFGNVEGGGVLYLPSGPAYGDLGFWQLVWGPRLLWPSDALPRPLVYESTVRVPEDDEDLETDEAVIADAVSCVIVDLEHYVVLCRLAGVREIHDKEQA